MQVVVNGLMTNYHKVGRGKLVVLLHGWGDTSKTFSKLIEELQADYTVLAVDLPGFGGSQTPPNAWGLADYVDFVRDWLGKIDAGPVFAVGGHSFGGSVAIAGLAQRKLKADRLFLIASAGIRNKKATRKKALKAAVKVAKLPFYLLPKNQRAKLRRRMYGALGSDAALLPHMELTYKRIIGEDVQTVATKLKLPVLLIYGDKDVDTPASDGRLLHKLIAGSQLKILPAGHFLHQERSDEVGKLIARFLEDGHA